MLAKLMPLVVGLLFGLGLHVSGMTDPERVLGFLDVAGAWDPTLAFVMGGALLVTLPVFLLVQKGQKPWFDTRFYLPSAAHIDRPLLEGAAMFGLGWGLVGLCPGPALANLVTLRGDILLFVAAMVLGMLAHDRLLRR
jgi:uncharacterized membrane protein YedE/YeeE